MEHLVQNLKKESDGLSNQVKLEKGKSRWLVQWVGVIFFLLALSLTPMTVQAQFSGGLGISSDPYIITTAAQLDAVRTNVLSTTYYKLANDIDLAYYITSNYGAAGWLPIGDGTTQNRFFGNFDGNGHTISGLRINRTGSGNNYMGLFGTIRNATVENLGVELAPEGIYGNSYVGGLAGSFTITGTNNTGSVKNCYVIGDVNGNNYVGGLLGEQSSDPTGTCTIESCYTAGSVEGTGGTYIGGLVGYRYTAGTNIIKNCYSTCDVKGTNYVGGLVGWNRTGYNATGSIPYATSRIENCYSTGNVIITATTSTRVAGGLVGGIQLSNNALDYVEYCFSISNVTSGGTVGGIIGSESHSDGTGVLTLTDNFRYELAKVNTMIFSIYSIGGPKHGDYSETELDFMTKATYDNSWFGSWNWNDNEKYPQLNLRGEKYPFPFYAITYNLDGGTLPPTGVEYYYIPTTMTAPYSLPIPTKVGHLFEGWFDSSDRRISTIIASDKGHKWLTAKWTLIVPPYIEGTQWMTLDRGYATTSTEPYTIAGNSPVTITKFSGDDHITWNDTTKTLVIAAGLPVGVYEVELRATNRISTSWHTLIFELTVREPVYWIEIGTFTAGTITADVGYVAEEGQTVTLTLTPFVGRSFETITAFDLNNRNVRVALSGSGNTYTFKMPAHHVLITATTVDIDDIQSVGLKTYVQNNILYISGLTAGRTLRVYNVLGVLIKESQVSSEGGELAIPLPGRGIYIVTDGYKQLKISN